MEGADMQEPYPGAWHDWSHASDAVEPRDPVDCVTDIATLIAVHTAEQYVSVAELRRDAMRRNGTGMAIEEMVDRSLRLELASALRITEYAAGELLSRATVLVDRFPQALHSLFGARITDQHARFLTDLLGPAPREIGDRLIDRAVHLAEELPAGAFRRALRKLIEEVTAETLTERHEHALTRRYVRIDPTGDGMSYLTAYLPSVEAHAIFDRLTRMGKTLTGRRATGDAANPDGTDTAGGINNTEGRTDSAGTGADGRVGADAATDARSAAGTGTGVGARTLDQVRADIFSDLLIDGACPEHPATTSGIRPTVVVTVPALSLLDDAHAKAHPATVEGLGPIPIDKARELCGGSSRWMRVLTHPETGIALSVGRTRYDPPPELARLVRWKAERCMAPGCGMPASRCEIDHTIAWADGGHTALGNHAPLCTGHHHVKHHGGWRVTHIPDSGGILEWTSPYGRRYLVEPERRMPTFTPQPESTPPTAAVDHAPAPF